MTANPDTDTSTHTQLAELQRLSKIGLPALLGIQVLRIDGDEYESAMTITPQHLAPNGYLHAASVIALADTTCGFACRLHLPEGAEGFTTAELKSNHLGTMREGTAHCIASPLHTGRTTQVWDARVFNPETEKTIAAFRCTQIILWPK